MTEHKDTSNVSVDWEYNELKKVLDMAYIRASVQKGRERHASGEPFHEQKICQISRWLANAGATGGPLFQAAKKIFESTRIDKRSAVNELCDAIVYISAAIILLQEEIGEEDMASNVFNTPYTVGVDEAKNSCQCGACVLGDKNKEELGDV